MRRLAGRGFWTVIALASTSAVAAGWFVYSLLGSAAPFSQLNDVVRRELASLPYQALQSSEIEAEWSKGIQPEYLVSPAGPEPCPAAANEVPVDHQAGVTQALRSSRETDGNWRLQSLAAIVDSNPGNLIPGLILGTELIHAGRFADSERVLDNSLSHSSLDEQITVAAREGKPIEFGDAETLAVIHLQHALGVARLSWPGARQPWVSLKNVIGAVKIFSAQRLMGATRGTPAWSRLLIPPPGCRSEDAVPSTLTSYDLFNNLLVAYMRHSYVAEPSERSREFNRPDVLDAASPLARLLRGQVHVANRNGWQHESQLWALSNVQMVVDWQRPDDARFNVSAIHIIDWWVDGDHCAESVCTQELREQLRKVRDTLLEDALLRRNVTPDQRASFVKTMVRLVSDSGMDRSRFTDAAGNMRGWAGAGQPDLFERIVTADTARRRLPSWLVGQSERPPPFGVFGADAGRWRNAATRDYAAAVIRWLVSRPPDERRLTLIGMRAWFRPDEVPPDLDKAEAAEAFFDRMRIRVARSAWWRLVFGTVTALLVWWVLVFVVTQIHERRLLRTSFYNIELRHLRVHGGSGRESG